MDIYWWHQGFKELMHPSCGSQMRGELHLLPFSHSRGLDCFRQWALTIWGKPPSDEEGCNSLAAEYFSLFIVVYQFQIWCQDFIAKGDYARLSSPYAYLCCNNGGTWKEVHKALRVYWLTSYKGQEKFPHVEAAVIGIKPVQYAQLGHKKNSSL